MAIRKEKLETIIKEKFPKADFTLIDLVGDEDHYSLEITSEEFRGKTIIAQHRMVNEMLKSVLKNDLHAITIKTLIPRKDNNE
jgi:stress-induced morphogen